MTRTGNEIITIVRRELKETSPAFWSNAELLEHINRAEADYVNRTRILEDTAYLSLEVGRSDYRLPSNWLSAKLVLHNEPDSSNNPSWQRVWPSNLQKMAQEKPNFLTVESNTRGRPQKYFIWNNTLRLDRAPATVTDSDLMLWYKAKPIRLNTLNDPINLDDSLSEAIVAYILWKAWLKKEEKANANEQKGIYFDYIIEGRKWNKKRTGDEMKSFDIISNHPFIAPTSSSYNPLDQ